ncbi:DUF6185 family protein [Streptomyces sp.]|uniref:DUF6185 family protein n=1 Tax=Streptomyces sp. TaxID=1931 RepID=UPI002D7A3332|nr:DUF6185 family protein [Streptomyces sp.]HET6359183.1 DUF6185 family protein [Streptomyces sp.]
MHRLVLLLVLTGLFVLHGASPDAEASDYLNCYSDRLKAAKVTTSVRIKHDGEDYTKAEVNLVVEVPKSWKPAPALLLNGDTEEYRAAMRCVLRDPYDRFPYRDTEWRLRPPKATAQEKTITLEYWAVTYVDSVSDRYFGPWRIDVGKRFWTLTLESPPALQQAWWQEITVDLGGRAARGMSPAPTKGSATELTWTRARAADDPPEVTVRIQPPATKALATRWNEKPWYLARSAAWLSWDLVLFPVLLLLVRRLSRSPVRSSRETPAEEATRRNLLLWACLSFAAALVFEFDDQLASISSDYGVLSWWPQHRVGIDLALAVCGGAAFCLFGRPRIDATVAVVLATAYPLVVAVEPGWFGLPAGFWLDQENVDDVERLRQTGGFLWLALACCCVVFVWLVGTVSALLRLRRAVRIETAGTRQRGCFPWWVLAACVLAAAALVTLAVWARQNIWEQETWLSAEGEYHDRWHLTYLYNGVAWFPSSWTDWFHPCICGWYGLIGAFFAVIAARAKAPGASPVSPGVPETLLISVFFVATIAYGPGWYVGLETSVITSVPVILLAGLALLALGNRRAVLAQRLAPTTAGTPGARLRTVIQEADRRWLIESAREYRDLHSQLRRLEQGDQDGERTQLEQKLDQLHTWNPPGATAPHAGQRLPDSVDAVELALAWGPRDTWWLNGRRAAYFAALFALPATGVGLWADAIRGTLWGDVTRDYFGVVGLLDYVITSEVVWASTGFVLGVLWRLLPGRRGPAKALLLCLGYATPIADYWLLSRAVGQSIGTLTLDVALTLLVLTSTGVAMDIDTFRQEGHYWPTKAALLLSIYQLRTASVQLAFFVAQLVALVGVWQQLKGNDPMVLIQQEDPTGKSGAPGPDGP